MKWTKVDESLDTGRRKGDKHFPAVEVDFCCSSSDTKKELVLQAALNIVSSISRVGTDEEREALRCHFQAKSTVFQKTVLLEPPARPKVGPLRCEPAHIGCQ